MTIQNKIMADIVNPTERRIYVGMLISYPISQKLGSFAYHIERLNGEERTDSDFSYFLPDDELLVEKLNLLKNNHPGEKLILVNGIPRSLTDGWIPDCKFLHLPGMEFKEIKRITGLESKV